MLRRPSLAVASALLLAGPFVLAFFSGGFFDRSRIVAAIVAWALVAVVAVAAPRPLPAPGPALLAIAGLGALLGWSALSLAWAPVGDAGFDDVQRALLYLGALVAATALLRERAALRALEPVVVLGALVLVLYGMGDRLLPRVVFLEHYFSSGSRLEQPLTYWNAMGLVAATGLVLAARVAGDRTRSDGVRALAVAAAPALGLGLYLTFSRGAIAALAVGTVVLLAAAPSWSQLRGAALALEAAAVPALVGSRLPAIVNFDASETGRDVQGAAMLVVLGLTMLAAGAVQGWACRAERAGTVRMGHLPGARRAAAAAALVVALTAAAFVGLAARERGAGPLPTGAATERLASTQSNRYQYWRVALDTFADHPLAGTGAGGFRVEWLRRRTIAEQAKDAHSLYLETAAELGIVGLAALGAFGLGLALAARRALRAAPAATAGAAAGLATWAFHAGLDWHWEMPAVTLLALLFAGALAARSDAVSPASRSG